MLEYTGLVSWFPSNPSTRVGPGQGGECVSQCDPSWSHWRSLYQFCSVSAKAQTSRDLCASYSGLLTSTLEEVLEMPSLVSGVNTTSALYSHNCAASPVPPPDPNCQPVSFDLFLDPDIQLDLDWKGYIFVETWSCTASFFTEIINDYV